jgi:hypothetical protein
MKINLVDDWKKIATVAWSIRLSLIAALFSAGEAAFQYYLTGQPPIVIIAVVVASLSSAVARLVAQQAISGVKPPDDVNVLL